MGFIIASIDSMKDQIIVVNMVNIYLTLSNK